MRTGLRIDRDCGDIFEPLYWLIVRRLLVIVQFTSSMVIAHDAKVTSHC